MTREERNAWQRAYYLRNKEKLKPLIKKWNKKNYEENKEERNAVSMAWAKENPDRIKAIKDAYYLRNKEKIKARASARYYAKKAEREEGAEVNEEEFLIL